MLCETNSTVRPVPLNSSMRPRHFFWNAASPTASTSSTSRISGSKMRGHREREPHVHPARVALDWRLQELREVGELDDVVEALLHLCATHAHDRAGQDDVLPASELRMEAGPNLQQRADAADVFPRGPTVGGVIRARILSIVLFPAPFRPMMPTVSPARISNETSFRAQKSRLARSCCRLRSEASSEMSSRSERYRPMPWVAPMR